MDMNYVEIDNGFNANNEISDENFETESFTKKTKAIIKKESDDVFARRRERGAFSYFPSAIF